MSIWQIIGRLIPFVKPYRRWVVLSLGLTLLGAFAAQVNPVVLRYTVDTIERLLREGRTASQGTSLLLLISAVLLGKEVLNTGLRYGQNLFGEKIRVNVSSRLSRFAVEKILTYRLAFYTDTDNQTGILQTRVERGAESLTKLVQSAFIDILPLFANALLALVIMFMANVYVGLVASAILPVYFLLSQRQASMLKGARRRARHARRTLRPRRNLPRDIQRLGPKSQHRQNIENFRYGICARFRKLKAAASGVTTRKRRLLVSVVMFNEL